MVCRMVPETLIFGAKQAVSTTVRTSALIGDAETQATIE